MGSEYVHGYSERERVRLSDQAATLSALIHHDTVFEPGSLVLEAGCGVGAQTRTIAGQNPESRVISVDISPASVLAARNCATELGIRNASFATADIFHLPFPDGCFDHVFICFVLEHLANPGETLRSLRRLLKPGGRITVIEGDHGSVFFHPESAAARKAIACQVELQRRAGGNALIGRELYPLLDEAGYRDIAVSPRMAYADGGRPQWIQGFTRDTFTAMIEGVREPALAAGLTTSDEWNEGIRALYRTSETDGTFCYTFFKGTAQL